MTRSILGLLALTLLCAVGFSNPLRSQPVPISCAEGPAKDLIRCLEGEIAQLTSRVESPQKACALGFAPSGAPEVTSVAVIPVAYNWKIENCREIAKTMLSGGGNNLPIKGFRPMCLFSGSASILNSIGFGRYNFQGSFGDWQSIEWSGAPPFHIAFTPSPNCGW